jgi:hypothetical protein
MSCIRSTPSVALTIFRHDGMEAGELLIRHAATVLKTGHNVILHAACHRDILSKNRHAIGGSTGQTHALD